MQVANLIVNINTVFLSKPIFINGNKKILTLLNKIIVGHTVTSLIEIQQLLLKLTFA